MHPLTGRASACEGTWRPFYGSYCYHRAYSSLEGLGSRSQRKILQSHILNLLRGIEPLANSMCEHKHHLLVRFQHAKKRKRPSFVFNALKWAFKASEGLDIIHCAENYVAWLWWSTGCRFTYVLWSLQNWHDFHCFPAPYPFFGAGRPRAYHKGAPNEPVQPHSSVMHAWITNATKTTSKSRMTQSSPSNGYTCSPRTHAYLVCISGMTKTQIPFWSQWNFEFTAKRIMCFLRVHHKETAVGLNLNVLVSRRPNSAPTNILGLGETLRGVQLQIIVILFMGKHYNGLRLERFPLRKWTSSVH